MSADYFPTDVRVRIDGSQADGRALMGPARSLLFRALDMQAKNGSDDLPVFLSNKISDDAFITVLLVKGQKIVHITTTSGPVDQPVAPEFTDETPVASTGLGLSMLSGIIRSAQISSAVVNGKTVYSLHEFAPSNNCSTAQGVPAGYHDNTKLAIPHTVGNSQYLNAQASWYSGTMKRVVQYVQGLGYIADANPAFVAGTAPPTPTPHPIAVQYNYKWATTHGIYTAGTKNHWLIEISPTRGVLAMPLPLVPLNLPDGSVIPLGGSGDAAMAAAVSEFGGLPSGDTFPTGAKLTAAIANGTVLQLLMPGDLDPFYVTDGGQPHSPTVGWAFSESGALAHTTRWSVKTWGTDAYKSCTGEYWEIALNLSMYDLTATAHSLPVGTGTAVMRKIHEGRLTRQACAGFLVSYGNGDDSVAPTLAFGQFDSQGDYETSDPFGRYPYWGPYQYANLMHPWGEPDPTYGYPTAKFNAIRTDDHENNTWGCVLHAFFTGEQPRLLKWVPHIVMDEGGGAPYDSFTSFDARWSPAGYISDIFDWRRITPPYNSRMQWYVATLPAYCREGYAITMFDDDPWNAGLSMKFNGFINNVTVGNYNTTLVTPLAQILSMCILPTSYKWYFGASVNAVGDEAWVITEPPRWAMNPSHNYQGFGLVVGSESNTADTTVFVGGY